MAVSEDPEQQLAWEARQRPRAGIAAILAGLLTLGGEIWTQVIFSDAPRSLLLDSVGRALESGPVGGTPSGRVTFFEFYDENTVGLVGSAVARGLGLLALAWAVTFLAAATRARRQAFAKPAVYIVLVGAVLTAIGRVLGAVGVLPLISDFLDGPRTVDAARDLGSNSMLLMAEFLGRLVGPLALASGLVLVALNAMRAGLLTRFLGILGMITGALIVIPIGPLPVVQSFWLFALGALFLGYSRGGVPPAWRTGREEPWPSQKEMAEARRAQAQTKRGGGSAPEPAAPDGNGNGAEPVTAGYSHPSSKKRKRKRRG